MEISVHAAAKACVPQLPAFKPYSQLTGCGPAWYLHENCKDISPDYTRPETLSALVKDVREEMEQPLDCLVNN
eukprot:scaffold135796_cov19-Tisochrysis_lutea.AAC.1